MQCHNNKSTENVEEPCRKISLDRIKTKKQEQAISECVSMLSFMAWSRVRR